MRGVLREIKSPFFLKVVPSDLNNSPEALWRQAEVEDRIMAKLQIGSFRAIFPNRPYTPEGCHFMLSPRSKEFESIQSIEKKQLEQVFTFLSPILEQPGAIIGYNEAFDINAPSAKSWKNLHLHIITLPLQISEQGEPKTFSSLFRITDEDNHREIINQMDSKLKKINPNIEFPVTKDSLGINLYLQDQTTLPADITNLVLALDSSYREITNNQGSYVVAIQKSSGRILFRAVPTTYVSGFTGRRFGLMEAVGYSIIRYQDDPRLDNNKLYNNSLIQIYDLLSRYLNRNNKTNWDEWYFAKSYVPQDREIEQETRHKLMFDEVVSLVDQNDIQSVIEIGVGSGTMMKIVKKLSNKPISVIGIDLSHRLLSRIKDSNLVQADTFSLPFSHERREQTIIFHQGLIEHFDYDKVVAMLKEQLRVAKYLIFSAPSVNYIFPQGLRGDERLLSLDGWLTLLRNAGFKASGQYYGEKQGEKYHILIGVEK